MNEGLLKTAEGVIIKFEVNCRTTIISLRDEEKTGSFCLTLEETIDLCNALQKKVITALYAKSDGL
jgi:hypothetical protein